MYTTFGILTLRRNFTPSPSPPLGEESPPRRSMRRIRRKTADELNYHYPQISPEETGRGGGRGGRARGRGRGAGRGTKGGRGQGSRNRFID